MKKSQLRQILKPIVKECINEVLIEQGLLSNIISEVVRGLQPIQQPATQSKPVMQESKLIEQQRQELEQQKFEMMKEQKRKLLDAAGFGTDIFAGTDPMHESSEPSDGQAGALSGISPNDPGVDIAGIMALGGRDWRKMI